MISKVLLLGSDTTTLSVHLQCSASRPAQQPLRQRHGVFAGASLPPFPQGSKRERPRKRAFRVKSTHGLSKQREGFPTTGREGRPLNMPLIAAVYVRADGAIVEGPSVAFATMTTAHVPHAVMYRVLERNSLCHWRGGVRASETADLKQTCAVRLCDCTRLAGK